MRADRSATRCGSSPRNNSRYCSLIQRGPAIQAGPLLIGGPRHAARRLKRSRTSQLRHRPRCASGNCYSPAPPPPWPRALYHNWYFQLQSHAMAILADGPGLCSTRTARICGGLSSSSARSRAYANVSARAAVGNGPCETVPVASSGTGRRPAPIRSSRSDTLVQSSDLISNRTFPGTRPGPRGCRRSPRARGRTGTYRPGSSLPARFARPETR